MHSSELSTDCHALLRQRGGSAHPYLILRSRITDHAIYQSHRCWGLLEHRTVTHRWTRLPVPWPRNV